MVRHILIICVGNICRSPMAKGLMCMALPECEIESAGLGALVGQPADPIAVELMQARGVDISNHRARQLEDKFIKESDLVLVMELNQQHYLERQYPLARGKIFRLAESAKTDIPDPYRKSRQDFEDALKLIVQGVNAWTTRIVGINSGLNHKIQH
jgi:protein-tyrosine phosphatase